MVLFFSKGVADARVAFPGAMTNTTNSKAKWARREQCERLACAIDISINVDICCPSRYEFTGYETIHTDMATRL
jgi:hypothetical protein